MLAGALGAELRAAVAQGERFEEADAMILIRGQFTSAFYVNKNHIQFSGGLSLRVSNSTWVLRVDDHGEERELGRYPDIPHALDAMRRRYEELSSHNKYARKRFIR